MVALQICFVQKTISIKFEKYLIQFQLSKKFHQINVLNILNTHFLTIGFLKHDKLKLS